MNKHRTRAGRRCEHAFTMKYERIPGARICTRSWEPYSIGGKTSQRTAKTMEAFVSHITGFTHGAAYQWRMRKGKTAETVAKGLVKMNDFRCPQLTDLIEDMSLSTRSGVIRFDMTTGM